VGADPRLAEFEGRAGRYISSGAIERLRHSIAGASEIGPGRAGVGFASPSMKCGIGPAQRSGRADPLGGTWFYFYIERRGSAGERRARE